MERAADSAAERDAGARGDSGHDSPKDHTGGRTGGLLGKTRRLAGSGSRGPSAPGAAVTGSSAAARSSALVGQQPAPNQAAAAAPERQRPRTPAITLDEDTNPESPDQHTNEPRSVPERLAALASQILEAHVGLEAPGVLFAILKRHLGIGRAAILVPDAARALYTPWASEGLDQTSLRRLRLTREQVADLALGTAKGETLRPWLKLFSTRDGGAMECLHHWPCRADEGATAVVVAQEMTRDLADDPVFHQHLPEILEAVGHALADRRERELARGRAGSPHDVTASPERFLDDALTNAAHREAVLVRVNLGPLLAAAVQAAPATDPFRLTQDIALALAYWARDTAEVVIAASPEELYLLFHGAQSLDTDLWVHTLLGALERLLPTLGRIPELPRRSLHYPRDGTTAQALMGSLG